MARKKKVSKQIFTSFYDFNKWIHTKDWITKPISDHNEQKPLKQMAYGYEVVVPQKR